MRSKERELQWQISAHLVTSFVDSGINTSYSQYTRPSVQFSSVQLTGLCSPIPTRQRVNVNYLNSQLYKWTSRKGIAHPSEFLLRISMILFTPTRKNTKEQMRFGRFRSYKYLVGDLAYLIINFVIVADNETQWHCQSPRELDGGASYSDQLLTFVWF